MSTITHTVTAVVGYLGDFNGPDLRQHLAVNEAEIADVRAWCHNIKLVSRLTRRVRIGWPTPQTSLNPIPGVHADAGTVAGPYQARVSNVHFRARPLQGFHCWPASRLGYAPAHPTTLHSRQRTEKRD